ncbi:MAG: SCO family protein [Gammaproteobacteria bacterium]|nr:SCO family protein [Gammaproteobacteria bacterium]NIR82301.1 SCO family protein [Gammaproteobacteria bacterium]NIR91232.1 SCO family protein [Gammaproteobacteria bacterium]NIU03450.1 SCO family protein [Gammaproteobacteria bacterium]NIX84725.1 SCO family protein [Gammaproteobacteria bacterium]
MHKLTIVFSALAATALGLALGAAVAPDRLPELPGARVLPDPRPLGRFELVDHAGESLTPERLRGRWTFVFLGYSHCPDVCPTTLGTLNALDERLQSSSAAPDTHYLFVSVDPRRDTPARLREYVTYFNEGFLGATGTPQALAGFARDLGLAFEVPKRPETDDYPVSHSAYVALIGPEGRLQAYFSPPHEAGTMAAAYQAIREHREGWW